MAEHGYRTAIAFFRRTAARQRRLFAKHGIACATRAGCAASRRRAAAPALARVLDAALDRLGAKLARDSLGRLAEPDGAPAREPAVDHPLDASRARSRRSG